MKNKPFLGKKASLFYIGTVILVQPYWVLEITANFVSPFQPTSMLLSLKDNGAMESHTDLVNSSTSVGSLDCSRAPVHMKPYVEIHGGSSPC